MDIIDLETNISTQNLTFPLTKVLWKNINDEVKNYINSHEWTDFKYLDNNGNWSPEVNNIPNDMGGIYIFYINPNIIKSHHRFLCYIGRAHMSNSMNLRTRVKCYRDYEIAPKKLDRPKLRKLFLNWGENIFCHYLQIPRNDNIGNKRGNDLIDYIEAELINGILPPCNTEIPDVDIKNAKIRAFM